jgi:hypothetical protein
VQLAALTALGLGSCLNHITTMMKKYADKATVDALVGNAAM